MDHADETNGHKSDPNYLLNSVYIKRLRNHRFSMLPTVLGCFSRFSVISLRRSLCLQVAKTQGFNEAILVIRNSWAMAAAVGEHANLHLDW
jgi:hypothetical protein